MIVCVSANPAIDKRLVVDEIVVGEVNRVRSAVAFAGGKAAHVAMSAKALGEDVTWIGVLGGETGDEIERQLAELGVKIVPVRTASVTRTNLEIIDKDGRITEVLEPGGVVDMNEMADFRLVCSGVFMNAGENAVVVLSGSLPPGMPTDEYASLTAEARKYGANVIVDASGEALNAALAASPDLIKPNRSESEFASGISVNTDEDALHAAAILRDRGAKAVALTLGGDGLLYVGKESGKIFARPPKVDVISTVGCGDATVAGFAVAMKRRLNDTDAVRLASACGAANCLAMLPGQITRQDVESLIDKVRIEADS